MRYGSILAILGSVVGTALLVFNLRGTRAAPVHQDDKTIANFFSYEGALINQQASLQTLQHATVPLKQVFAASGYKLAFILTDVQCDVCVEFVVGKLDSMTRANPSLAGKVVMLAGYDNWIQFSRYVSIKKIKLPVYQFEKAEIDAPFTKLPKPSVLLVKEDMAARYVFVPDKGDPVLFDKYLHFAERMLLAKT